GAKLLEPALTRWIDFNDKYGLGYQLSDSSVGVNFKNNSHLVVVDGAMKNFQYVDKNSVREYYEYNKCPTMLGKNLSYLNTLKKLWKVTC
uniref:Polo kinase n=1 Tax=Strongyloides papillosus TaxID=174720 RepID=A0A0N5C0Y6_STREA